jgi:hypothetical protein
MDYYGRRKTYTTNVRKYSSNESTPTVSNSGGYFALNGLKTKISYAASYTIGSSLQSFVYYRLTVTAGGTYYITAYDIAGNGPTTSVDYKTNIDTTSVSVSYSTRLDSAVGASYDGTGWTNRQVYVLWTVHYGASGFGELTYTVDDGIANTSGTYKVKIPTIVNNGGKVRLLYYNASNVLSALDTAIAYGASSNTIAVDTSGGKQYWKINGQTVTAAVNTTVYGLSVTDKTWTLYSGYLTCAYTTARANQDNTYYMSATNGIKDIYAVGNVIPSGSLSKTYDIKIDVDAPVIDASSGNIAEIVRTDIWHAYAKSVRVDVSDALSGIGRTTLLDSSYTGFENVKIECTVSGSKYTAYLVKCDDGLYRAYNLKSSGGVYSENGLFYLSYYTEYKITATDAAGNSAVLKFTPRIDTDAATVSDLKVYDADGAEYTQDLVNEWVIDAAAYKNNWSSKSLYATMEVTYGKSGYILQYAESPNSLTLANSANSWTTLTGGDYEVLASNKNADGSGVDTVKVIICGADDYMYEYMAFRAVSNAQNTELNVYKDFVSGTTNRGKEVVNKNGEENTISIKLESYEAADKGAAEGTVSLSPCFDTVLLAVDKSAPSATLTLQKNVYVNGRLQTVQYGCDPSGNIIKINDDQWANNSVKITLNLSSASGFASGNAVFYQTTEDGITWTQITMITPDGSIYTQEAGKWVFSRRISDNITVSTGTKTHDDDASVVLASYADAITYTITGNADNVVYRFWSESGAGLTSGYCDYGSIDRSGAEIKLYGIKIDTLTPSVNVSGKATYTTYASTPTQAVLAAESAKSPGYIVTNNVSYTKYNTVIICVQITQIGYSGAYIYKDNDLLDTITFEQYTNECKANGTATVYRYYYVSENGESHQAVNAVSIAGNESNKPDVCEKIDNTTPIVYVKSVTGTKASNWGWTTQNLYTSSPEFWYVSITKINLGVGIVENGAFADKESYSGYRIEYSTDNGAHWKQLNGLALVIDGISVVTDATYIFRITSNPEKIVSDDETGAITNPTDLITYNLGGTVFDNRGNASYAGKLNDEIETATGVTPVTAHVVKTVSGKTYGDYDDGSYRYTLSVDRNNYNYNYDGRVILNADGLYDNSTSSFVSKSLEKSDSSGNYASSTDTNFHRGDLIRLSYVSKWDGAENANHYFQSYTVSTVVDGDGNSAGRTVTHCVSSGNTAYEKSGSFELQFESDGISVTAYFIAEVYVTYGGTTFYKQTDTSGNMATTGAATYVNGTFKQNVTLEYAYYKYSADFTSAAEVGASPAEVGAYYVATSVKRGTGSFRVTNANSVNGASDKHDFAIEYFNPGATSPVKYHVDNAVDFGYVDNDYYQMNADGKTVNRAVKTYLASTFDLTADITADGIDGEFTGVFAGNNHTVTLGGGIVGGNYGLFDTVKGTVHSINIVTDKTVTLKASAPVEIGLLCRTLDGAAYDITVKADIEIETLADGTQYTKIGGLAAKTSTNAEIGNGGAVFADVRIGNEGNGADYAYVSPLIGYLGLGTKFYNVYSFGEATIWNAGTHLYAGMVYGGADAGSYSGTTLDYFGSNTFVNDVAVSGMSSGAAAVSIVFANAVDYDTFAGYSDMVIAGVDVMERYFDELYSDFGYTYSDAQTYGIGTAVKPLVISTMEQIQTIDSYVNLAYAVSKDVSSIDMSGYKYPIARHKIFFGSLSTETGKYVKFTKFASSVGDYDNNMFGLVGQLGGTVKNIVFNDISIDLNYTGSDDFYAGIVAAKVYDGAEISNIVFIGTENITARGTVYAGGVAGSANGGTITDIFDIVNISANSATVILGGIAGKASGVKLPDVTGEGAVYLLGRVEGSGSGVAAGAAIGSGAVYGDSARLVYAVKENVYSNGTVFDARPIGGSAETYGINVVDFEDTAMRSTNFKSGANAFGAVFGGLYPLTGYGTSSSPFIVTDAKGFSYINLALYASYTVQNDITFTDFETIGEGLLFTGTIKGSGGSDISAEESSISVLTGLTAPLVWYNAGNITDLSLNVEYSATVKAGETFRYGSVAIYNKGTIKNITVAGTADITSETNDTVLYVSGFVAESYGGSIEAELAKIQNSISALNITVSGGGTAYVGGYAGLVRSGTAKFSYGIATGTIDVTGVRTVYAGLLVGASYGTCDWTLGAAASVDYTYTVTVNGITIEKEDEDGNPITANFYGIEFTDK